jgi:hypothetical protein
MQREFSLKIEVLSFSGAWILELGAWSLLRFACFPLSSSVHQLNFRHAFI